MCIRGMDGYIYFLWFEGIIKCVEYFSFGKGCKVLEIVFYSI